MSRERLPNRRLGVTDVFVHGRFGYDVTLGTYPDGRIGEVFLTAGLKTGTEVEIAAGDMGVLVSIALQHGATVDELRAAVLRDEAGRPAGLAAALLDAMAVAPAVVAAAGDGDHESGEDA